MIMAASNGGRRTRRARQTVYLLPMGADEGEGTEEAGGQLEEQETGGRREARATARMG